MNELRYVRVVTYQEDVYDLVETEYSGVLEAVNRYKASNGRPEFDDTLNVTGLSGAVCHFHASDVKSIQLSDPQVRRRRLELSKRFADEQKAVALEFGIPIRELTGREAWEE